jgi:hypothetical protein
MNWAVLLSKCQVSLKKNRKKVEICIESYLLGLTFGCRLHDAWAVGMLSRGALGEERTSGTYPSGVDIPRSIQEVFLPVSATAGEVSAMPYLMKLMSFGADVVDMF